MCSTVGLPYSLQGGGWHKIGGGRMRFQKSWVGGRSRTPTFLPCEAGGEDFVLLGSVDE